MEIHLPQNDELMLLWCCCVYHFSELLDVGPSLIIATTGSIVELNAQTLDLISCTSLLGR